MHAGTQGVPHGSFLEPVYCFLFKWCIFANVFIQICVNPIILYPFVIAKHNKDKVHIVRLLPDSGIEEYTESNGV